MFIKKLKRLSLNNKIKSTSLCIFVLSLIYAAFIFGQNRAQMSLDQNLENKVSQIEALRQTANSALSRLMGRNSEEIPSSQLKNECDEQVTLSLVKNCTHLIKTDLGHGSGFAIDQHYLVTNKHVVEGAKKIETWTDNTKLELTLWNYSENSDLAVLYSESILQTCAWADSQQISLAENLFTVGWPNSPEGESSITKGIFSRFVDTKEGPTFIQTDAAINPGNSGGPLVSECGIVGVNTAKIVWLDDNLPTEGFSFAISSHFASQIIEELISSGSSHSLPIVDMGEVEYSFAQQKITPVSPSTQYIYTTESKQSWTRAKEATRELKEYWFSAVDISDKSKHDQLKDIIIRMESVIGQVVIKIENDQPLSEDEISLSDRWSQMYQQAVILEEQLYNQDYSLGYGYKTCQNYACVTVAGRGFDKCQDNQECAPRYHYRCQDLTCIVVEGDGENECTSHDDCYYYECRDNQCQKIPGDGTDQCYFDWQCK